MMRFSPSCLPAAASGSRSTYAALGAASLWFGLALAACSGDMPYGEDGVDASADSSETRLAEHGEPCEQLSDCAPAHLCAGRGGEYVCMRECEALGRLCEPGGEVCVALDGGDGAAAVCYVGGFKGAGERCATNVECERGALCFGSEAAGRYCLAPACHRDTPRCERPEDRCHWHKEGDASRSGWCQPPLGQSCEAQRDCEEAGLTCSIDPALAPPLSRLYNAALCTRAWCEASGELACPASGACLSATFYGETTRFCARRCERDAQCRFQLGERCWREEECAARQDEQACRALLEQAKPDGVCLADPLSSLLP